MARKSLIQAINDAMHIKMAEDESVVVMGEDVGYDGVWCSEYEGREGSDVGYRKCCEWLKANL